MCSRRNDIIIDHEIRNLVQYLLAKYGMCVHQRILIYKPIIQIFQLIASKRPNRLLFVCRIQHRYLTLTVVPIKHSFVNIHIHNNLTNVHIHTCLKACKTSCR